jgi:ATP-dependent exoDNAse (exonuclease V) beta subunit
MRPNADPALPTTVVPGAHTLRSPDPRSQDLRSIDHQIVWWDPRDLTLGADPPLGIRRSELIVKDVPKVIVDEGLAWYQSWRQSRDTAAVGAASPSIAAQTATAWAKARARESASDVPRVEIIEIPRDEGRPTGIRFGTLVHSALATVPLDADSAVVERLVISHARALGAKDQEVEAATKAVQNVLAHPLFDRARDAAREKRCRREVPVTWRETTTETLVEGFIDLAFRESGRWTVVDFKTDEEMRRPANYAAQVHFYAKALHAATAEAAIGILMRI